MRQVTSDVSRDLVPHGHGLDIGQLSDHFFVVVKILAECLRIFVDEFDGYSLDVGGSYSSHIVHRVMSCVIGIRYINISYEAVVPKIGIQPYANDHMTSPVPGTVQRHRMVQHRQIWQEIQTCTT